MANQDVLNLNKQKAQQQGNVSSEADFYKNVPMDQLNTWMNTQIQMPKGPADQAQNPDEPWGKPEGWDYQTAKTDWKGNPLPPGAVGFKPDGTAWYGGDNDWQEWLRSWKSRINAPAEQSGADYWKDAKNKLGSLGEAGKQGGFGGVIGGLFGGFGDALNALGNVGMKEGEVPTGMAKASRGVGQLLMGAGMGLGRFAEIMEEQVFSRLQGLEDIAEAGGKDMDRKVEDYANKIEGGLSTIRTSWFDGAKLGANMADAFRFVSNLADVILPTHILWNGINALSADLSLQEKRDIMKERVESSKILYSSFIEPALKEQYLGQVKEGRHPYLVAQDLQKPFAEMAGQMLLDPLNIVGLMSKGAKVVGGIQTYQDYMARPLEKFADFFKAGKSGIARFDDGQDITVMAERLIEARKDIDSLVSVPELTAGKGLRPKINKALEKSGVFGWSASGKRHHLQRLSSDMLHTIVSVVGKEPEEALNIVKWMTKLQSDDVLEVTEALGHLAGSKMPLNMITSEGGMRFGAVFRELLMDADGVMDAEKFINKVSKFDNPLELRDFFDKKIEKVAQRLFPDLGDRAKILQKIDAGDDLTTAERLIGNTPLTGGEKFWLKAENLANNKMLKAVNGFFANVYMGLSPGYAFRNLWTNEFHLLVDMGVGKYVKSWSQFNPRIAEQELEYLTRSSIGQLASIGIGQTGKVGGEGKLLIGKRLAGYFEKIGGQRAYGMAYRDTLNKKIPKILDEITPALRSAGATEEQIAIYRNVVKATYGRFDEAGEALANALKAGEVSLFEQMGWMPDEMLTFFDNFKLGDGIRDIIRAGGDSSDEVIGRLRNIYKDVVEHIKSTETRISLPERELQAFNPDGLEHADEIFQRLEDAVDMSDDVKAGSTHAQMMNRVADNYVQTAMTNDIELAKMQGIDVNAIVDRIMEANPKAGEAINAIIDKSFYKPHHEYWREKILNPVLQWNKRLNNGWKNKSPDEIVRLAWKSLKPYLNMGDDVPKNMSTQQMKDLIWNVLVPTETRAHYAPLRDAHATGAYLLHEELIKAGLQVDETLQGSWASANTMLERARAYDTHIVRDLSWDAIGRATGDNVKNLSLSTEGFDDLMSIKKMGIVNNISGGVFDPKNNRMIPTNNLLKKINEGLTELGLSTYEHLDEVPFDEAREAIRKLKGKDFNDVYRTPRVRTKIEIPPGALDVLEEARNTDYTLKLSEMDARVAKLVKAYAYDMAYGLDSVMGTSGTAWKLYPDWWKNNRELWNSLTYKSKRGGRAISNALNDIIEGNDGTEPIFDTIRSFILEKKIPGMGEMFRDFGPQSSEGRDLVASLRKTIVAYSPEPSVIDEMMDAERMLPDVPANLLTEATFEGGGQARSFEEIQGAFFDAIEDMGFDPDDAFFKPDYTVVPSPEMLSDPHAFLAGAPELNQNFKELFKLVDENFGKVANVYDNPGLAEALENINKMAGQHEVVMRATANEVGTAMRNFALVNYDSRRNIDTLTGLLMPYQFWYSRTYPNWARRVAKNPAIMAHYYRYKEAMAQAHAGMPEWWQGQINSYELLGLMPDHPLFYNLEQTLNPLQGLTNTDFEDPYKRVDGWSRMLDDLNRFGPTTNPIYSFGTAFAYLLRGEQEASARWGGRMIPQTSTINALGQVLGIEGLTKEIDPAVWLFSGGVDPYMRRRVGRAFPQMIMEGQLSREQAMDATWAQDGEWWEQARQRAIGERAPGQLFSFFFGLGFKGRNQGDMATDRMYEEFYGLMNSRQQMNPDVFKERMNELNMKYPFMDSVLVSAKTGWARDMAFAYNVLRRIPPGDTSKLYNMAGIDRRLVDKFYTSRGDMDDWADSDRRRFMAGIIDMNAMLAVPDDYTSTQWTNAKSEYSRLEMQMKENWGEDILDRIDHFYALKNAGEDGQAEMYIQSNPDIELAMTFKTDRIVNDPTGNLEPYYSSLGKIAGYYKGQMYDEAEKKWPGIFQTQTEYFSYDDKYQRKQFLNAHPELKDYWDFKEEQSKFVNQKVIEMSYNLPEGIPAQFRQDIPDQMGIGAQDIQQNLYAPEDPLAVVPLDQWVQSIGMNNVSAIYRYLESGESFDYATKNRLRDTAEELDTTMDGLIQYVGLAIMNDQGQ